MPLCMWWAKKTKDLLNISRVYHGEGKTKLVLWNNYFQCLRILAHNQTNLLKDTPFEMLAIIAYVNQQLQEGNPFL